MTARQTAYKFLSNFDLEIDFAWYFYEMKEKFPEITRKEIIDLYNGWQERKRNNDEWGDRYVIFPKCWEKPLADGSIAIQIPE